MKDNQTGLLKGKIFKTPLDFFKKPLTNAKRCGIVYIEATLEDCPFFYHLLVLLE